MPSGGIYWDKIEPYWDAIDISYKAEDYLDSIKEVPRDVVLLFAVHWCNEEICNGGFLTFFYNSTGVLVPEALEGYRAIGAVEHADLLEKAMAAFPSRYPRGRDERRQAMKDRFGEDWPEPSPFEELDLTYFDLLERCLVQQAADEYAKKI